MSVTTELEKDSKQILGTMSQEFQTSELPSKEVLTTFLEKELANWNTN